MTLDPEEQAEADVQEVRDALLEQTLAGRLQGEVTVLRQPQVLLGWWIGLLLALVASGMTDLALGAVLVVALGLGFVVTSMRRVSRLRIGPDGSLEIMGRGAVDWDTLKELEVGYRSPWWVVRRNRMYQEVLAVRLLLSDGRTINLAQGPVWRTRPRREPLGAWRLERWLLGRARAAGMVVRRTGERGWVAERRTVAG